LGGKAGAVQRRPGLANHTTDRVERRPFSDVLEARSEQTPPRYLRDRARPARQAVRKPSAASSVLIAARSRERYRVAAVKDDRFDMFVLAVLTVGSVQAGTKSNVIPDHAVLQVNIRTYVQS
jgi:acetylornithine deacetylase/succinyl-diaminopimelate desuccinylase-like protein